MTDEEPLPEIVQDGEQLGADDGRQAVQDETPGGELLGGDFAADELDDEVSLAEQEAN